MARNSFRIAVLLILTLGAGVYARQHRPEDLMNAVEGVRITSRLPCDGATNPREDVRLLTTFSTGGWERTFRLDEFESQYCRYLNLHFFCVKHGHDGWRSDWAADNTQPPPVTRYWLSSCTALESKDAPRYILSGWYKEGAGGKLPWKQAALKQVSSNPEIYEFADANGGTARIEIQRR